MTSKEHGAELRGKKKKKKFQGSEKKRVRKIDTTLDQRSIKPGPAEEQVQTCYVLLSPVIFTQQIQARFHGRAPEGWKEEL